MRAVAEGLVVLYHGFHVPFTGGFVNQVPAAGAPADDSYQGDDRDDLDGDRKPPA
jgi:peptidoglycan/LPS O-acetylase OafA/YrhL